MPTMHGRRGVSKRDPDGSEPTAEVVVGDGSGDGTGDDFLTIRIGLDLL